MIAVQERELRVLKVSFKPFRSSASAFRRVVGIIEIITEKHDSIVLLATEDLIDDRCFVMDVRNYEISLHRNVVENKQTGKRLVYFRGSRV